MEVSMKAVATLFLLAVLTFGGDSGGDSPSVLSRIGLDGGREIDAWGLLAAGVAVAIFITARRLP
jgi:hypothetical protein